MKRGRELYREGTPENIKKGYTDLVYGGENVTVDKGVISAEGSGGGGLPEVTDADNGDVLTVVNGEWSNAAPSGGGSDATYISYDGNNYTADFTDLKNAIENGTPIIYSDTSLPPGFMYNEMLISAMYVNLPDDEITLTFINFSPEYNQTHLKTLKVSDDNSVVASENAYVLTPVS